MKRGEESVAETFQPDGALSRRIGNQVVVIRQRGGHLILPWEKGCPCAER